MGPGNIATAALLAPMAMAIAARAGIPPFLMAIMVGNGANAGALSPFAPTGIIVNGLMDKIGLPGFELRTYLAQSRGARARGVRRLLPASAAEAVHGSRYAGGRGSDRRSTRASSAGTGSRSRSSASCSWLSCSSRNANIGMAAFRAPVVLARCAWPMTKRRSRRCRGASILMVCGVTVLIALLEKTRASICSPSSLARVRDAGHGDRRRRVRDRRRLGLQQHVGRRAAGVPADGAGPVARLGGDPFGVATSMNVGGHLVDVSPLSTIGALCIAGIADPDTGPRDLQQAARVGAVDDSHRRDRLLAGVLIRN